MRSIDHNSIPNFSLGSFRPLSVLNRFIKKTFIKKRVSTFMPNLISVSSAPIAKLDNKKYYDLIGTLKVMKQVFQRSAVDGFELQLQPEWDSENPPLTDPELADWTKTPKYTTKEILVLVRKEKLPVLSIHASRDIGSYLCSTQKRHMEKGKRSIHDSLFLATELGADICVFHLWDTRKTEFNIDHLEKVLSEIAAQYPKVKASVENIPTHLKGQTPFSLVKSFKNITLDLRWAALYDELDAFESIISRIVNIHLRGALKGEKWILDRSSFSFNEALDTIKNKWKYQGPLTVEPEGGTTSPNFEGFLKAMKSLRTQDT